MLYVSLSIYNPNEFMKSIKIEIPKEEFKRYYKHSKNLTKELKEYNEIEKLKVLLHSLSLNFHN